MNGLKFKAMIELNRREYTWILYIILMIIMNLIIQKIYFKSLNKYLFKNQKICNNSKKKYHNNHKLLLSQTNNKPKLSSI